MFWSKFLSRGSISFFTSIVSGLLRFSQQLSNSSHDILGNVDDMQQERESFLFVFYLILQTLSAKQTFPTLVTQSTSLMTSCMPQFCDCNIVVVKKYQNQCLLTLLCLIVGFRTAKNTPHEMLTMLCTVSDNSSHLEDLHQNHLI